MKSKILAFLALLAISTSLFALDPHDAQVVNVTAVNNTSTAAAQTVTIATLTTHAVNSGTNSYFIDADVEYSAPLGGLAASLELSNAGTPIASTVTPIAGQGVVHIRTEVENIAGSTAITLQALIAQNGVTLKIKRATLTLIGLAGNTQ